MAQLPTFDKFIGRKVDRVVDFLDLRSWKVMRESAVWTFDCWKNQPAALTISVPMLPKDGTSTLKAGADGAYDGVFREVARLAVESGRPDAVMRIGWEFNGEWYPWSSQRDPIAFIAYWRRIVTVMRSVAGQRFRFEWCFALADRLGDPSVAYPGDDVVDIISADVYNQTWKRGLDDPVRRWASMLDGQFGLKWHRDFALGNGKPSRRTWEAWQQLFASEVANGAMQADLSPPHGTITKAALFHEACRRRCSDMTRGRAKG